MKIEQFENHLCIVDGMLPCANPFCSRGVMGFYYVRVELPSGKRTKYQRAIDADGLWSWKRLEEKMNAHRRMVEARR